MFSVDPVLSVDPEQLSAVKYYHKVLHLGCCSSLDPPLSSIYDKDKNCVLKLVTKSAKIRRLYDVFMDSHSTQEDVGNAGIDIFRALYGSKSKFYHISSSKYLQHKMRI